MSLFTRTISALVQSANFFRSRATENLRGDFRPPTMRFRHKDHVMGFFKPSPREPTKGEFAQVVIKALGQIGDQRTASYDEAEFQLTFTRDGKSAGMMNLANLYAEYCRTDMSDRDLMLRRTCVGFVNRFETPVEFEDAKHDLLPSLRVKATEEQMRLDLEIRGAEWTPLVSVPLSEHIDVCLVYDLPDRMQFVTQRNLDSWGVSAFEAAEVAKQNLAEREFAVGLIGARLYAVLAGDAYDAARMVLLDHVRAIPIDGQPVAMPVNRDALMFAAADDAESLGTMAEMAEMKEGEPRPLCSIPHILVGDEWLPWMPPADHPHYERFKLLSLKYYYRDYAEQKKLLDKLHEKTGDDVFVSTFSAVERDSKVRSYCVWAKNVVAWLPKTDYVALYVNKPEQQWFVRWDRVQEVAGDLLTPLDCYPPRWLVKEWPTTEQIEVMAGGDW